MHMLGHPLGPAAMAHNLHALSAAHQPGAEFLTSLNPAANASSIALAVEKARQLQNLPPTSSYSSLYNGLDSLALAQAAAASKLESGLSSQALAAASLRTPEGLSSLTSLYPGGYPDLFVTPVKCTQIQQKFVDKTFIRWSVERSVSDQKHIAVQFLMSDKS